MEEIMDWTDNFNENMADEPETSQSKRQAIEKIAQLWVEYALLESGLRQFKKAQQVFENALADPIAGKCGLLFIEYANYSFKERGKVSNAQKVYVKGVTTPNMTTATTDALWVAFLALMHTQAPTSKMTLEGLVAEVSKSVPPGTTVVVPSSGINLSTADRAPVTAASETIESKNSFPTPPPPLPPPSVSASCVPQPVPRAEMEAEPLDDTQGITAEVLFKRHSKRLPTLLAAPGQEPLVSGLRCLDAAELNELSLYFNQTCGSEHEQYLPFDNETLLVGKLRSIRLTAPDPTKFNLHQRDAYSPLLRLELVLDLVEACWISQALKERHFDSWFSDLFKIHNKEVRAESHVFAQSVGCLLSACYFCCRNKMFVRVCGVQSMMRRNRLRSSSTKTGAQCRRT